MLVFALVVGGQLSPGRGAGSWRGEAGDPFKPLIALTDAGAHNIEHTKRPNSGVGD